MSNCLNGIQQCFLFWKFMNNAKDAKSCVVQLPCKYGFSAQLLELVYMCLSLYFSQFWCCKFVRVLNAIFHTDQIEWDFRKPQISRLEMFRVNGKVPCNTHKSILTNQSDWPCLQLIHSSWCLLVTVVAFIIRERILREHTRAHRHADVLTHTQLG